MGDHLTRRFPPVGMKYGGNILFDLGLGESLHWIAKRIDAHSAIEIGCGLGMYIDFLTRLAPEEWHAVGLEPENMHIPGLPDGQQIFGHDPRLRQSLVNII